MCFIFQVFTICLLSSDFCPLKPDSNQFSLFRISNIEQGISNDEVFFPFDIHYSLFGVLRFSVF
jgi:hypothetical protein